MVTKKNLFIFVWGLAVMFLVACAKPANDSDINSGNSDGKTMEREKEESKEEALASSKLEKESENVTQSLEEATNKKASNNGVTDINNKVIDKSQTQKKNANSVNEKQSSVKKEKASKDMLNNEKAIQITVEMPEHRTVEADDPSLFPGFVPISEDNPMSIETNLSINSEEADVEDLQEYSEEKFTVFKYTYDCYDGCWKFTKSPRNKFYFYTRNDECPSVKNKGIPKMLRNRLSGNKFIKQYLDTEDWFYAPYEDADGNIYAECGQFQKTIYKMNSAGKTLNRIDVSDIVDQGYQYKSFALIKKNIIAVLLEKTSEDELETKLKIIDINQKKLLAIISLNDNITANIKSDGDHFALISSTYQSVFVFDANTFQLVNTVDTTKCKELCTYEWEVNDWESGRYRNLTFDLDIRSGKIYFLRHSGIYMVDCDGTKFTKVMDGEKYADFKSKLTRFTSFMAGEENDFYILGVYMDEESATTMWHYTM